MAALSDLLALALEHHQAGRLHAAEQIYRQILALDPNQPEALHLLGVIAHQVGRHETALELIERAIRVDGARAEFHSNLGQAYRALGKLPEASACFQRAIDLKPDFAPAHIDLGLVLHLHGQLDAAVASFQQVLNLEPDCGEAHGYLASALQDRGSLPEAIASYRQALEYKRADAGLHSHLLYLLHFCPGLDAQTIFEEHRRWNEQHAQPLARFIKPHANDPSPDRRLRIGYVSPSFSFHPAGWFMLTLLQAHDRKNVEVFLYPSLRLADEFSERCRACADGWRAMFGLSDEQFAQTVREDRIDILVDLTAHVTNNRLLVFARKPAPVQLTYLAYCGTTGLDTMDYRLTDPYLDPPDLVQEHYAEKSIWLPQTYWCYRPPVETPRVNSLPALEAKHITFGCLNDLCKVTEPTLAAWRDLLRALPEARLLLHGRAGSRRAQVRDFFAGHHVAPERLTFVERVSITEYFKTYERIDVALDPFPYGGGTTTCDALWMGVPVVSLAGKTAVGRGGLSILSNVGLSELVARDAEHYVRIAVQWGSDLSRLSETRTGLRARMQASPLMDAPRFAQDIEATYREMWQHWCATQI